MYKVKIPEISSFSHLFLSLGTWQVDWHIVVGECLSQFAPNYGPMENVSPKGIGIIHGSMGVDTYREREVYLYRDVYKLVPFYSLLRCWRHDFIWNGLLDHVEISTDSIWSVNPRHNRVVSLKISWPGEELATSQHLDVTIKPKTSQTALASN